MTGSNWYVDVDFISSGVIPDGVECDVLEMLSDYSAVIRISRDRLAGGISLVVDSIGAQETAALVGDILHPAFELLGELKVTKIDVMDESTRRTENQEYTFPELVGYAEIAHLANISRQRARQIASRADFPAPVVETVAGPLRTKAAVEKWLSSWNRKPGRPRGASMV